MTFNKMILAVGIGNTNLQTAVGEYSDYTTRHIPIKNVTGEGFSKFIEAEFGKNIWQKLDGSVLSTVFPERTSDVVKTIEAKIKKAVRRIDAGNCGGITSIYEGLLGEDRLVCCAGAIRIVKPPFIVADFGTATTINIVSGDGTFIGGTIMTGVKTGLLALSEGTAQLPLAELAPESPLIGVNTGQNLISGAVIGAACALDGYVSRIWNELGYQTPVIITGGDAAAVYPYLKVIKTLCAYEPELLIKGLFAAYDYLEAVK